MFLDLASSSILLTKTLHSFTQPYEDPSMPNAIILAGGFGTRLRPLSCTIPKPMLPVVNKPLLDFIITRLVKGIPDLHTIVIAVNYKAADIEQHMKAFQGDLGVEIIVQHEKRPLGTGGAVGFSKKYLDGDRFFMLNGDIISLFDYQDMYKFHVSRKATATITGMQVDDVSRYGVMVTDGTGRVEKFIEKPSTPELVQQCKDFPINAGTYILEPSVFDLIPPQKKMSIERDVFPPLVEHGHVYSFGVSGMWRDLGLPEDYLNGNFAVLDLETKKSGGGPLIQPGVEVGQGTRIIPPVAIDKDVIIGSNCTIGPNAILGYNVEIADGVSITSSILLENSFVDAGTSIEHSIVGDGCWLGNNVRVKGLVILGSGVTIDDRVTIASRNGIPVKICPWITVHEDPHEDHGMIVS